MVKYQLREFYNHEVLNFKNNNKQIQNDLT